MIAAHPLIAKLAQEQQDLEPVQAKRIDASREFTAVRRRQIATASSYATGRAVIAWAKRQGVVHAPCFQAVAAAIAAGELIAMLLADCWCDYPDCRGVHGV